MNTNWKLSAKGSNSSKDALTRIAEWAAIAVLLASAIAAVCWGLGKWADSLPPAPGENIHIEQMRERGIGQ